MRMDSAIGMLQRVMIALALAQETKLIIADEPTSALDVIHQRMIIEHLKTIQKSFVCVSHDLGVIAYVADKTLVMKEGTGVEYQPTASLFDAPQHPYTRYLIESRATCFPKGLCNASDKQTQQNVPQ